MLCALRHLSDLPQGRPGGSQRDGESWSFVQDCPKSPGSAGIENWWGVPELEQQDGDQLERPLTNG